MPTRDLEAAALNYAMNCLADDIVKNLRGGLTDEHQGPPRVRVGMKRAVAILARLRDDARADMPTAGARATAALKAMAKA
jgi:hypothetical protein